MIKLIKSTFYKEKRTISQLNSFLKRARQLSFGEQCIRFQNDFAKWQGRKYCILLNSGSSANLAIIQALINMGKVKKNDMIGFSAITWSTNVMPMIQLGLTPIPIDVDLSTLNISNKSFAEMLRQYPIKAIFITHLLGFCGNIDEIISTCVKHKIILIEDTCESLGTVYKGKKLGNFGYASTFSFYVGHHMSTIEGGAVCTDDEELAVMLSLVRAHGWDRNLTYMMRSNIRKKFQVNSMFDSRYIFYDLGYNLRPTEIVGFLGRMQLKYLDKIVSKRSDNFNYFANSLYKKNDLYYPVSYDHIDLISNFSFPIVCKTKKIRENLVKRCRNKLEIRPIVGGSIVEQPFFKKYFGSKKFSKSPIASFIHDQGFYFGNNPELTIKEKKEVISILSK
ncbi:MAG: DegT/DnrJ/EryC1/StrS aminotransferase family protein [Patescibacteria group bacterium]|nr:DegT/DnrJ/EryC1/StrS aminotransferase family protein [Actinomycetota bacterium]MCL5438505.1 DegT/DnrJ/EryC1/StrS aminotransferase family protein [Patescibacteria group bacterium]